MFLEIVSPEAILFSSEVTSVSVPGIDGEFQMLNNHDAIISILKKGTVKIEAAEDIKIDEKYQDLFTAQDDKRLGIKINSGVIELKKNKLILLVD